MHGITVSDLPFYWRLANNSEKKVSLVKERYPFVFEFDNENGLLIQKRDPEVLKALEIIYRQDSNIGYLQDANEIAKPYGTDFMRFIDSVLDENPGVKNVLEVGCGGCVVLAYLKNKGLDVKGIDSSPFAATEGNKKSIYVITDFFPSQSVTEKFDLIYHVDVLEHISEPVSFLRQHHNNLSDSGIIIVNVPDATESIVTGDISMAMHQHLNYFTENSLRNTLQNSGFDVISITRSGYGGSLYGVGRKSLDNVRSVEVANISSDEYKIFIEKANLVIRKFGEISNSWFSNTDNTVGFYVPLRTLPYIAIHEINNNFRFFDDTHHWHYKEFDGLDIKIENFSDLKNNPVTHMFVMSLTFGEVIKKKLVSEFGDSMTIITLSELIKDATS